MNAQTEQLIYWKQQADHWKAAYDLLSEQNEKAVQALRVAHTEATELLPQRHPLSGKTIKQMASVLVAIDHEEAT